MFLLFLLSGEFFIINGCWILSKAFSASIEIIIWILFFNLLMWWITLIDLWILKNPCIPGIKPAWSWCMIFLMCCWILIARILLILERVVSTAFSSSCLHLKNHSFVYCSNCSVKISHVTYNQLVDRSSGFDSSSDSSTPLSIW